MDSTVEIYPVLLTLHINNTIHLAEYVLRNIFVKAFNPFYVNVLSHDWILCISTTKNRVKMAAILCL